MAKVSDRRDVLLLLLYSPGVGEAPNEAIVGRTRLVKTLFLFKNEALKEFRRGTDLSDENFYDFFPWNFGPFSTEVYDDLTFFILRGFIEGEPAEEDALPESAAEWEKWFGTSGGQSLDEEVDPYVEEVFRLTPKGLAFARDLYHTLSRSQQEFLKRFKARLCSTPLRAILRYVYETYPDQTDRSQIRESILGRPPTDAP